MRSDNLYVEHRRLDHWCRVSISGEVDLENAATLGEYLQNLVASERQDLALDLSELGFMDSSGLRMLLTIKGLLEECGLSLVLTTPAPPISKVLKICGLEQVLTIVDCEEKLNQLKDGSRN